MIVRAIKGTYVQISFLRLANLPFFHISVQHTDLIIFGRILERVTWNRTTSGQGTSGCRISRHAVSQNESILCKNLSENIYQPC